MLVLSEAVLAIDYEHEHRRKRLSTSTQSSRIAHGYLAAPFRSLVHSSVACGTAATLRLFPQPGETSTALLALDSSGAAVELLAQLRGELADGIEAFELISAPIFDLVEKHIPEASLPFDSKYRWYVLLEA